MRIGGKAGSIVASNLMNDEKEIQDLIPLYALGSLDAEETAAVEALLAKSHTARQELSQFNQVTDLVGMAAPAVEPSADFEDRLFARLNASQAAEKPAVPALKITASQPAETIWQKISKLFAQPQLQMATGFAMLFLLFGSGMLMVQNQRFRSDLADQANTRGLPSFQLASPAGVAQTTGLIVMSLDGVNGTAIIDGMDLPDDDSQYQLWLSQDGVVEAGPTFNLNDVGYGARWVVSEQPLDSYDHFEITLEPAGGSERPTSEPVLEWSQAHEDGR